MILGPPDALVVDAPFTSARGVTDEVVGITVGEMLGETVGDGDGVFFFTTAAIVGLAVGL